MKIAVDTQGPDIFSRVSTTSKKMLLDGQPKSFLKKIYATEGEVTKHSAPALDASQTKKVCV